MQKIGVVGASGQLGSSLLRVLSARALPISRTSSNLNEVKQIIWAAGTSNNRTPQFETEGELSKIKATLRNIDFSQLQKVLLISSGGAIYGTQHNYPILETEPLNPESPYANLKADVEKEFKKLCSSNDFSLIILRLSNVYSAHGKGLISNLLKRGETSPPLELYVDPDSRKQYGHSDDFANLIVRYMDEINHETSPQVFNVYSPHSYSIGEIISIMQRIRGVQIRTISPRTLLPLDSVELVSSFPDFIQAHNWLSLEAFVQQEIERCKE